MAEFFQASYFIAEVIALLGIGLNAFQILHTVRKNRKQAPFESSILSLSIADLLSSSFTLAYMMYWHLWYNALLQINSDINKAMEVMVQYSILSSIFHLLYIAFIRITAVLWPMKFRLLITSRFSSISLSIIWILSFGFSNINEFLITSDIIGYIVISAQALLFAIYTIICCTVKKQDKSANRLSAASQRRPPVFRRTLRHSVSATSAFILCALPMALFYVGIVKRVDPSYSYECARWMFYLNPMIDSMLYFYFSKKLLLSHKIRFNFKNQWNCNFYSFESAANANKVEMIAVQKFTLNNTESQHVEAKSSDFATSGDLFIVKDFR